MTANTATPEASAAEDLGQARSERLAEVLQQHGAIIVLVALLVIGSFAFNTFASADNLRNIVVQGSFLAIVALGMTFVILTGGIDLSVGSVYALGGVLAAYGSSHGFVVALLLPLVVCGLIGALQGALVAFGDMAPFIVTLAGLLGARGLVIAITDEGATTPPVTSSTFAELGQGTLLTLAWPVFVMVALYAIGFVWLQRTRGGQSVLAVGGSEDAATLMGLPVARVKMSVYVMSGLVAGLAGALNAARSSSGVTTVGVGLELEAISAVVIGGTLLAGGRGGVTGTLAGVFLLGVIQNFINQVGSLTSSIQSVVSGLFLLVVVVVQTVLARTQRL